MLIRHAVAALDASACAAVYRPFVEFSVASLEERPPTEHEFASRIEGSRVEVLDDCGHALQGDQPEQTFNLVTEFLR